jgi:alpha-galactosidase
MALRLALASAWLLLETTEALDNGLALTPPMGWRSWNCYHGDVSQAKIEATIDAIVEKRTGGVSLLDLRFSDVGVDDGWQACGTGRSLDNHSSFHAADGTPLVNKSKFQDVKAMVAYGHKNKGLTMGWYNNNCMCMDEYTKRNDPVWERASDLGDVKFLLENGFGAPPSSSCHYPRAHQQSR